MTHKKNKAISRKERAMQTAKKNAGGTTAFGALILLILVGAQIIYAGYYIFKAIEGMVAGRFDPMMIVVILVSIFAIVTSINFFRFKKIGYYCEAVLCLVFMFMDLIIIILFLVIAFAGSSFLSEPLLSAVKYIMNTDITMKFLELFIVTIMYRRLYSDDTRNSFELEPVKVPWKAKN